MDFIGSGGNPGYFNRYAYTMNDPVNFSDPTGKYRCSKSDCKSVDKYYNRLSAARDSTKAGSPERALLDRSLKAIGTKGEKGSPKIKIDKKLKSPANHSGNTIRINPDIHKGDVDKIASDLAHEGSHEATKDESGPMKTRQDRFDNEFKAYETTIAADKALGRTDGWQNAKDGAEASVKSACTGSSHSTCK